ncbi:MAG: hypothetical protein ACR2IH_10880 [Pyrinomonadaceae bacterium]
MPKNIVAIFTLCLSLVSFAAIPAFAQTKEPAGAARELYRAWHLKNRRSALKVADRDAVGKLFGTRWRAMRFKGCTRRDEGGFECTYFDPKIDLSIAMIVDGGVSVGGYNVASISFSSEE